MNKVLPLLLALAGACSVAVAQEVKGVAAEGEKKASMCLGCHSIVGYQASFPEVHKVPMIAGQNSKYIINALAAYQKGDRKHPTMRAIAQPLTAQDMADLAEYFSTLGKSAQPVQVSASTVEPTPGAAALLKSGNCASCHGANFNSPVDPSYPKLAGQHADYLYVAAHAYMVEGNPIRGRNHAVMGGMIKASSANVGEREFLTQIRDVAAYFSKLPGDLKTVPESRFR